MAGGKHRPPFHLVTFFSSGVGKPGSIVLAHFTDRVEHIHIIIRSKIRSNERVHNLVAVCLALFVGQVIDDNAAVLKRLDCIGFRLLGNLADIISRFRSALRDKFLNGRIPLLEVGVADSEAVEREIVLGQSNGLRNLGQAVGDQTSQVNFQAVSNTGLDAQIAIGERDRDGVAARALQSWRSCSRQGTSEA